MRQKRLVQRRASVHKPFVLKHKLTLGFEQGSHGLLLMQIVTYLTRVHFYEARSKSIVMHISLIYALNSNTQTYKII